MLTERMRLGYGVDLVVDEQATRLVKLGYDVVVVVIHADLVQPSRDYELVILNKIMRVEDYGTVHWMKRILSAARVGDVDVWVLHTPPFYEWARWLDGPVIAVEYGTPPGSFFSPDIGRHLDSIAKSRLQELYPKLQPFDAIVSISRSIHDWLPQKVRPSSTVIHLGGDHFPVASAADAEHMRLSLGIAQEECLILWVGRMQLQGDEQPYKGFQELLELMPQVTERASRVRFVFVGRISDADRRTLTSKGISILGNLTAEEMAGVYAGADILLNLSRWEGFNLALLEAQMQGTPVVAYDFGPHAEIVQRDRTGILAKNRDEILKAVVRLAADPSARRRLGTQAREFARTLTWDKNVAAMRKVIDTAVANGPGREIIARTRAEIGQETDCSFSQEASADVPGRHRSIRSLLKGGIASTWRSWADAVPLRLGRREPDQNLAVEDTARPTPELLRQVEVSQYQSALIGEVAKISKMVEQLASYDVEARPVIVPASPLATNWASDAGQSGVRRRDIHRATLSGVGIGPRHVLIAAPGSTLVPAAAEWLTQAARAHDSDILFGDEFTPGEDGSPVLRVHGPFSEHVFCAEPCLGGVIAVHRSLLKRLALPPAVSLTGPVLLKLVAEALTLTYLPAALCARDMADIQAGFPSEFELKSYARVSVGRDGVSAARNEELLRPRWKAAVIVVSSSSLETTTYVYPILSTQASQNNSHFIPVGGSQLGAGSEWEINGKAEPEPWSSSSYSQRVNAAAEAAPADCDVIVIMDEGVVPTSPEWLKQLAETVLDPRVGAVAPKTLYQDSRIRHAGFAFGPDTPVDAPGSYISRFEPSSPESNDRGAVQRSGILREVSAVSHHCLVVRRSVFRKLGGFDERLGADAVDLDLCFRLRSLGLSVMLDGRVTMTTFDEHPRWSRSLSPPDMLMLLQRHDRRLLEPDPFDVTRSAANEIHALGARTTVRSTGRLPSLGDASNSKNVQVGRTQNAADKRPVSIASPILEERGSTSTRQCGRGEGRK